ncbi:sigma-70 family RNA polymerase sigma factor [Nibrella saemangeumensis]|uniref:Sigma-70 family RNA polymerase sigma factor n=1 Tax=Nibrella saemangeumensis TaxID=1084526 RepID=A0ABP8MS89_9BACT
MNKTPVNDAVWEAFQQGSEPAFRALYVAHYKLLVNYGRRFGAENALIEDAVHDLFLELWHYRRTLTKPQSIQSYLLKSFRNRLLTQLAQQYRFQSNGEEDAGFGLLPAEPSAEDRLIEAGLSHEQQLRVQKAMALLSPRQQEILYLRYFSDFDYEQICAVMGITYHTARTQMHQALTALRRRLQENWLVCLLLMLTAQ